MLPNPVLAGEDLDACQLVHYNEEALNLVLVANCEYTLDVMKSRQIAWEPKVAGFEKDVVDK